jgi:ubiquinone/menaquinone biosynthesis C-methylase UbiE
LLRAKFFLCAIAIAAATSSARSAEDGDGREKEHDRAERPDARSTAFEATSHRRFDDAEYWAGVFDAAERAAWQHPVELVRALALTPGSVVADLGAGTGYFIGRLSQSVGADGTVYAVEVEPTLIEHLRTRADEAGLDNVVPVLASFDNARLPARHVDLIVVVDTFHHIDDRKGYFTRLKRSLAPSGRIAIVDWKKQALPEGPPLLHKIARDQVIREMLAAEFKLAAEFRFLPYQYFLVFEPAGPETTP